MTDSSSCVRAFSARALVAAILSAAMGAPALAQPDDTFTLPWWTIDCGGGPSAAGTLVFNVTIGQPDAGRMSGGSFVLSGGFWAAPAPAACYANCDGSTVAPILTANDFQCFLNQFAAGDSYANCDGSTVPPLLTANDFQCFLNTYAAGCS